jgi:Tfp pilus assembly protein PilF
MALRWVRVHASVWGVRRVSCGQDGVSEYWCADAERTLREIVVATPDYVRAHTNLGLVLETQGRAGEAEAEYRRAIALEPGNRRAQQALARLGGGRR